jgi:hypothetical protein
MGEGLTALIEHERRGRRAHFKLAMVRADRELQGSRRDRNDIETQATRDRPRARGQLRERRRRHCGLCRGRSMRAKILVPSKRQSGKMVQIRAYGAETELISGMRQDTADAAQRQCYPPPKFTFRWPPCMTCVSPTVLSKGRRERKQAVEES